MVVCGHVLLETLLLVAGDHLDGGLNPRIGDQTMIRCELMIDVLRGELPWCCIISELTWKKVKKTSCISLCNTWESAALQRQAEKMVWTWNIELGQPHRLEPYLKDPKGLGQYSNFLFAEDDLT